jgi:gliding motility-associated-like protein
MFTRFFLIINFLLVVSIGYLSAQSILTNGGFENNRFCPNLPPRGEANVCPPWLQLGQRDVPSFISSFPNRCVPFIDQDVLSFRIPVIRTGSGSAELGVYTQFIRSDLIQAYTYLNVPLNEPLNAEDTYYFEMYVSPNDIDSNQRYLAGTIAEDWPINSVGAYFSIEQPKNFEFGPLTTFRPQILNKGNIIRSWNRIKDCLRPQGGERFMTLGVINRPINITQKGWVDDIVLVKLPRKHEITINKCNRNNWELDATLAIGLPDDIVKYKWQDGSTNPKLTATREGKYSVEIQVECKTYRDTVEVSFLDLGRDTTICEGQNLALSVSRTDIWKNYIWSNTNTKNPSILVSDPNVYWVKASVRSCVASDSITLKIDSKPILRLPSDTVLCSQELLVLNAQVTNGTLKWFDGSTNGTITISRAGSYQAEATNGCGVSTSNVNVKAQDCLIKVYVADIFTPNNDGINDVLNVFVDSYYPVRQSILTIYNRWGEAIFQSNDLSRSWDGTYLNRPLSPGYFVWQLKISFQKNEQIQERIYGSWLLLK